MLDQHPLVVHAFTQIGNAQADLQKKKEEQEKSRRRRARNRQRR